jgi:hypothetical protein
MGFLEKLLSGVLTKALGKLFDRLVSWAKDYFRVSKLVDKAKKFIGTTEERVVAIEDLQKKAAAEVLASRVIDAETGEILTEGKVTDETREAIRQAGRELIRGRRDDGH